MSRYYVPKLWTRHKILGLHSKYERNFTCARYDSVVNQKAYRFETSSNSLRDKQILLVLLVSVKQQDHSFLYNFSFIFLIMDEKLNCMVWLLIFSLLFSWICFLNSSLAWKCLSIDISGLPFCKHWQYFTIFSCGSLCHLYHYGFRSMFCSFRAFGGWWLRISSGIYTILAHPLKDHEAWYCGFITFQYLCRNLAYFRRATKIRRSGTTLPTIFRSA